MDHQTISKAVIAFPLFGVGAGLCPTFGWLVSLTKPASLRQIANTAHQEFPKSSTQTFQPSEKLWRMQPIFRIQIFPQALLKIHCLCVSAAFPSFFPCSASALNFHASTVQERTDAQVCTGDTALPRSGARWWKMLSFVPLSHPCLPSVIFQLSAYHHLHLSRWEVKY